MAAALGTSSKGSVNVELNIVPFIDLMSCLTAFLLVTAVWISIAQVDAHAGASRDTVGTDNPPPDLSVLVQSDGLWIGVSRVDDFQHLPNTAAGYDWAGLEAALKTQKASALFERSDAIQIAAESTREHPIAYQQLIATMDVAVKAGFPDVAITEPSGLSARPHL